MLTFLARFLCRHNLCNVCKLLHGPVRRSLRNRLLDICPTLHRSTHRFHRSTHRLHRSADRLQWSTQRLHCSAGSLAGTGLHGAGFLWWLAKGWFQHSGHKGPSAKSSCYWILHVCVYVCDCIVTVTTVSVILCECVCVCMNVYYTSLTIVIHMYVHKCMCRWIAQSVCVCACGCIHVCVCVCVCVCMNACVRVCTSCN